MKFSEEGRFRIVQVADPHFMEGGADKAGTVLANLCRILDDEKPRLVVFTGDIVTAAPSFQGLDELLAPVIERGIPWSAVLGNHDDEYTDRSRGEIIAYLETKPLSLTRSGESGLDSVGNYMVPIQSTESGKTAAALYFLDSGSYTADRCRLGFYSWINFKQIEWYRRQSSRLTIENGGKPLPALAFFHIPLPEYREAAQSPTLVGRSLESVCAPEMNSGFFTSLIEMGDVMGAFVGHDHDNDFAATLRGICLAYGRKIGGYSYTNHPQSGARVIELIEGRREFESWIRNHDGKEEFRSIFPK